MSAPLKPWESNSLQNNSQILKNENQQNGIMTGNLRSAPVLPPRPQTNIGAVSGLGLGNTYYNNSYAPYSGKKHIQLALPTIVLLLNGNFRLWRFKLWLLWKLSISEFYV